MLLHGVLPVLIAALIEYFANLMFTKCQAGPAGSVLQKKAEAINDFRSCPVPESNQRHVDFQSTALPTELTGHKTKSSGDRI